MDNKIRSSLLLHKRYPENMSVFYEPQNCGASYFLLSVKREAQSPPPVHCAGFAARRRGGRGSRGRVGVDEGGHGPAVAEPPRHLCAPVFGETRRVEHRRLKGIPRGDGLRNPSGIYPYVCLYPHYFDFSRIFKIESLKYIFTTYKKFYFLVFIFFFPFIHSTNAYLGCTMCFLCWGYISKQN